MLAKKESPRAATEGLDRNSDGADNKATVAHNRPCVNPQLSGLAQDIVTAFKAMYPEPDELKIDGKPLWITLWSAPQKESIHTPVFKSEAIPGAVKNWIGQRHVYFAPGLRCANLGRWKAGGNKDVTAIPGLWTETDIQGPGHVEQALPATLDEALELAYSIPALPPSLIIHSGGGIYPFWLFKEVWMLESKAEQEEAQVLLKRFERTILKHGNTKGWNLDSVADLRRVLRLPGSTNIKDPDNPRQVKILEYHPERRYNPSDFEPYLAELETTVIHGSLPDDEDFQPADFEKILSACPWIKHCQVDAAQLKEPEWYYLLSVVARCKDPEHWAHELSRPYPEYSEAETAKKLKQAKDRAGPVTCERVRKELNPEACQACKESVTSPVQLGRKEKGQEQKEEPLQGKQSPQKITPFNLQDIITAAIPEREYLLRPVIPSQGLVMLYAPRGVGKTYVALSCSLGMAAGTTALRWQAPNPSRVLYVDGEMPARLMQERIAYLVAGLDTTIEPNNFKLITPDLSGELPNLATPGGQSIINSLAESFDVLFLDNLSTVLNTGKESGNDEWLTVQGWLLELRRKGKSVVMVHHAGKSGGQRGNSRKEDILDTVVSLKRPRNYRADEGARVDVHFEKARGVYGPEIEPFEASLETMPGGALTWTTRDLEDAELEMVRTLVNEGCTVRDIAEETGLSKSKVGRLKKRI